MPDLAGRPGLGLKPEKAKPNPAYIAALHDLCCCICEAFGEVQTTPTTAHHTIMGRHSQRRTPDEDAIALCHSHHQGDKGIHTHPAWWAETYGADTDYIAGTQAKLQKLLATRQTPCYDTSTHMRPE